ncbi:MAG: hypothetical protein U0800_17095 [Isosphaeraceae bacterium]
MIAGLGIRGDRPQSAISPIACIRSGPPVMLADAASRRSRNPAGIGCASGTWARSRPMAAHSRPMNSQPAGVRESSRNVSIDGPA